MSRYARARAAWFDYPNTTTPPLAAHFEQWDAALLDLKNRAPNPVSDYGAKFDGSTDDTTALNTCMSDIASAGGGPMWLPPGTTIATQLTVPTGVILTGAGRRATQIKQKNGTTGHLIVLATTTTDLVGIRDVMIDGNKTGQSATNHGVYINNVDPQTAYSLYDPMFELENVAVRNCKGAGVYLTGPRGFGSFSRVFAQFNGAQGFYIDSPDHGFVDCWAGSNVASGFHQTGSSASCRYLGCLAFTNGTGIATTSDVGAGFYATTSETTVYTACQANANNGHGFQFDSCNKFFTDPSCAAGGNGQKPLYSSVAAGWWLKSPSNSQFYGGAYNYDSYNTQSYGVYFQSPNGSGCDVDIVTYGNTRPVWGDHGPNSTLNQNFATNGSRGGVQAIPYSSAITPDPAAGQTVLVGTLTGAITVNNPTNYWTGAKLTFSFVQDITGGRVVTLGSNFKASWTPDTTANKTNTISFVCDATSGSPVWVQTAAQTGL